MTDKPEKTKLEELSQELPEKERKELLAKLSREQAKEAKEEFIPLELKEEERERQIAEDMMKLTGWQRFLLWMKRLFTGKNTRDLFLYLKVNQIKHTIKQRNSGLTGFETRDLTPKFARQLFDLYTTVYPLRELCTLFSQNGEFREGAVLFLIQAKYAENKKNLDALITMAEMEEIFSGSGHEEDVKKEILKRINEYLRKIPDKVFGHLDEGLRPSMYLRSLIAFPYAALFRPFNYLLADQLDSKYPYFDHAPIMLMLDQLERLYAAVYIANRLPRDWFCHREFLQYYLRFRREGGESEPPVTDAEEQEITNHTNMIGALIEASSQFQARTPLLELIRYFRRDPYFQLIVNLPVFQCKPIYTNAFKIRILAEFEERMKAVKTSAVEKRIREVFKSERLMELFYYTEKPSFDFSKLGLPTFSYPKSLVLLFNYLSRIYKGSLQETVQLTNTYLLANNRLVQSRVTTYASTLEELEVKIVLFDRSLSPDEDDGKTLMRFRHRIAADLAQQKQYRGFILQKDREAKELLDRGIEALLGIKKICDEMMTSPMESVKSVLKTIHFHRGRNQTLAGILKGTSDMIGEFHQLLNQLLLIEKGS